jgi:hypothetical protein
MRRQPPSRLLTFEIPGRSKKLPMIGIRCKNPMAMGKKLLSVRRNVVENFTYPNRLINPKNSTIKPTKVHPNRISIIPAMKQTVPLILLQS